MRKKMKWMGILLLGILTLFFTVHSGWAKYPDKKIRFIVSFEPGGMGDVTARALVRFVNPYLQGRVYVETIAGAGGAVGWRECAKSAPDGYTMTILQSSIMVGPHVTKGFPTDDLFDPICIVALESRMLFVKMDSRFQTVQDLISYAKAHPGALTAATSGVGTINHIGMEAFGDAAGVKFTLVPYKGAGPSLVAAMGGHVDIAISSSSGTKSYVEGKKLRPLVVLGTKRYPVYPEVPTARELGYDAVVVAFSGVGVPRGVPKEVKGILVEAFRKATEDESYRKLIAEIGLEQVFFPPETAAPWLNEQREFFKKLADKLGMKPE
jgi:tripartite-type tricarboxylate transporter receptor subunit TctC